MGSLTSVFKISNTHNSIAFTPLHSTAYRSDASSSSLDRMAEFEDDPSLDSGEEEEEEEPVPILQEDIAKHPGRTKHQVQCARGLWATGTLEIRNLDADEYERFNQFVSRKVLCSFSGRIHELVPFEISWPILEWKDIINDNNIPGWCSWCRFEEFLNFMYTGQITDLDEPSFTTNWCLGAELGSPKWQNAVMKAILKFDSNAEVNIRRISPTMEDKEVYREIAGHELEEIDETGAKHISNGKFEPNKLLSYKVDRLVWEAAHGGFSWLSVVHKGGCIANLVARAQVDAAKTTAPRFAPWHIFNSHKYLTDENQKVAKTVKASGKSGEVATSNKRQRVE